MVNTSVNIPWNDGSGEDLTLTIQENSSGEIDIKVTSPSNLGLLKRKKTLHLSSSEHDSIILELSQQEDVNPALGDMEIGISFIIR